MWSDGVIHNEVVAALTFWNYVTSDFVCMSVVSVKEYFYCRYSRIVVHFDKKSEYFDCACCRKKRNCLHKKVALAHLALNSPLLIKLKEMKDFIPRSHYRAITTIALIVSDRDIHMTRYALFHFLLCFLTF